MEEQKINYFSYSKISLFNSCCFQYFNKYVLKTEAPEIVWPGTLLGTVSHSLLEDYIKLKNDGIEATKIFNQLGNEFENRFNKQRKEIEKPRVFRPSKDFKMNKKEFFEQGNKIFKHIFNFMEKFIPWDQLDWIRSEQRAETNFDEENKIMGYIDIQLSLKNKIHIIDLKITGDSSSYFFKEWDEDTQSILYDYLTLKNEGQKLSSFSYLVFDKTNNYLFFKSNSTNEINEEFINKNIKRMNKYKTLSTEEAQKFTNPEEAKCNWCGYNKLCTGRFKTELQKKLEKVR